MKQVYDLNKFVLYNRELKMEFAQSQYEESTVPILMFTFQKASEMEFNLNKDIYEFNREEIDELFLNFNCKTKQSIASKFSIIRYYLDFCISKGLVPSMFNIMSAFVGDEYYDKYINKVAAETQYIDRKTLDDIIEFCANAQDAVIIKLRYEGLTVEEMINLRIDDCKTNPITLRDNDGNITREFLAEDSTMELIEEAIEQPDYLKGNGEPKPTTKSPTMKLKKTDYVLRLSSRSVYEKIDRQVIAQRMRRIFELYDRPFLNVTNVWISGQIEMGKAILKETGKEELTTQDYITINKRYGYGEQYWQQTKRRLKDYVK